MNAAALPGAPVPTAPAPAWSKALGLALTAFGAGSAMVLLAVVALHAGADWFTAAAAIEVPASRLEMVRGQGRRVGTALVIEPTRDNGPAVAVATVAPFAAEDHPRVEWQVGAARPPSELVFFWRTRERPERTFSRPLAWTVGGPAPLAIAADDNWRGTIVGVGLAVRGPIATPVEIRGLHLPSGSAGATLDALFAQWATYFPLQGSAVAFPFDRERIHLLPMLPAVAMAAGLGAALLVALARWRRRKVDARVWWLLFAVAWFALDARWHLDLLRAVDETRTRYAGKTMEEKWLAADDAALYRLAQQVRPLLSAGPARILVLADLPVLGARLGHFLYPHNVYSPLKPPHIRGDPHQDAPDHDALRAGDYVLLFFYGRLRFDPAASTLVWPDGHVRPVTPLLVQPGVLLARVN